MKTQHLFFSAVTLLFLLVSCDKDSPEPIAIDKIKIAEASKGDLNVMLYADNDKLSVGFNHLYIAVENAQGKIGSPGTPLTLHTLMDMHTMEHSSPVVQPVFDLTLGLYQGGAVFTMPSGDMGSWKLSVEVKGISIDLDLNIHPAPANTKPVGSYMGTDGKRYVISLVEPRTPKTGINDLLILINEQENMHSFPAVDQLSIELEPEMPSMGHGSPNNQDPAGLGKGFYKGKVNFTMTGDWRLHFKLKHGESVLVEDAFLDLIF